MLRNIAGVIVFSIACIAFVAAQTDSDYARGKYVAVTAGLGVDLVNAADIVDYVNSMSPYSQRVDDFGVGAEFFSASEFSVSESWGMKLEYAYLIKSYNVTNPDPTFTAVSYGVHLPTVMAQYLIVGKGYLFKLGGGLGYHIAKISQEYSSTEKNYKSTGIGMKVEAEGNTAFDSHLYGLIAADVRYAIMSEAKNSDGKSLTIGVSGKNVKMNFFSLGIKFGLIYYF
jgi:hypothetical protein